MQLVILAKKDMLPPALADEEAARIFNPTLLAHGDGYIVFYRIVSEAIGRRIGACRLDAGLNVVGGSVTDFSQSIAAIPGWHADPRLFDLDGEVWLSWNNGILPNAENDQHVVRIDPDTLAPIGIPQKIVAEFPRRQVEKNWMFFSEGGVTRAVYSISPHHIVEAAAKGEWRFADRFRTFWGASPTFKRFGEPRGGAQPVRLGGSYYNFCHGTRRVNGKTAYVGLVYEFSAQAPFAITRFCSTALPLPNPAGETFAMPRLNERVSSVIYPTGAVSLKDGAEWLVSYGLNDEDCAVARFSHEQLTAILQPVSRTTMAVWAIDEFLRKFPSFVRRKVMSR